MSLKVPTPPRLALLAPFAALLALPGAALAQYQMMSPMLYEGPRISLQDHAAATRAAPNAPANAAVPPPVARPLDAAALRFRPDVARRRANLAAFVTRSRAADRAAGDSLARLFAEGDIVERMRPDLAKHGLSPDSVADAYTLWWICAWQASQGVDNEVSPAATAAVRAQFLKAAATAAPQLAVADDAAKQTMAESLLIQAMLLEAANTQAQGDPGRLQQVRTGAAQAGRGMGVELTRMTLTDQGFVVR